MRKLNKRKIIFGILFLLVTAFIFYNSAKPANKSDEQSGFLVELFMSIFRFVEKSDATVIVRKAAHITEFFAQGLFLSVFFFEDIKKYAIYVLFTGLLTAATDEFIQLFFEGRAGMIQDVFIDFSGTLAAVIIFLILFRVMKRMKKV